MFKTLVDEKTEIITSDHLRKKAVWIHGEELSAFETAQVTGMFHVDKDLLADAHDAFEVPRLEFEEKIPYLFIRYPTKEKNEIQTYPLLCILFPTTVITVSMNDFPLHESIVSKLTEEEKTNSRAILLRILTEVNSAYNSCMTALSKDIRKYQRKEGSIKNNDIFRFVHIENTLYDLSTALLRMETIYGILKNHEMFSTNEAEKDTFDDIRLESQQMIELMNVNIRTITNTRDAYTIILTNNLNRIIKMFTSFTVILTLPVLVASFYGMNVPLPFHDHPYAFFGILISCLLLIAGMLAVFLKKDWI